MSEFTKMVENMECDLFRQLPPKQILEHCMSMTLIDMKADGCDGDALEKALGAVWMASHARIFQYAPIASGDYLTYRTFPRVIEGNRYIYYVEIYRGDALIVRYDASYIPVDKKARHVLRIAQEVPRCPVCGQLMERDNEGDWFCENCQIKEASCTLV